MHTEITTSSSSSSTNTAVQVTNQTVAKTLSDQMAEVQQELCDYIQINKGLTTILDTSTSLSATRYTKYDMLDATAKASSEIYLKFEAALAKINPTQDKSRKDFLTTIEGLYQKTSYTGRRFPSILLKFINLYKQALKDEPNVALTIADAQARHKYSEMPNSSIEIAQFIKSGRINLLLANTAKKLDVYPAKYETDKSKPLYGRANRMDAVLNFEEVRLNLHMTQTSDVHVHDILHFLHACLGTLFSIRQEVGAPAGFEDFRRSIIEGQMHLENYRTGEHTSQLPVVRENVAKYCDELTGLINKLKEGNTNFDSSLAKQYLVVVKEFANSQRVILKLESAEETLSATGSNTYKGVLKKNQI